MAELARALIELARALEQLIALARRLRDLRADLLEPFRVLLAVALGARDGDAEEEG